MAPCPQQRPAGRLLAPLLLLLLASGALRGPAAGARAAPAPAPAPAAPPPPLVCVVVRTYWGHGSYGDNALGGLLLSLAQQTHTKCARAAARAGGWTARVCARCSPRACAPH